MVPFASDRSYEVLQLRRRRGELGPQMTHAVPVQTYLLPQSSVGIVNRRLRDLDAASPEDRFTPTWHVHRGRKGQR